MLRATDNPKNPLYDKGLVREVISRAPGTTSPGPGAVAALYAAPAVRNVSVGQCGADLEDCLALPR